MIARPTSSRGLVIGLGLLLAAAAAVAATALGLRSTWPGPTAALLLLALVASLVVLATLAYYLVGLASLRYVVSRDGIVLHWGASRTAVPMSEITHILQGRPYAEPLRGLRWPGHEVGRTVLETDDGARRELLVLATVPPERQLVVVTPDVAYAISPADRSGFVRELAARRRLGPVQQLQHGTRHPLFSRVGMAHDRVVVRLLVAAACLNALAFAWLVWHYPALPERVALWYQFDQTLGRPAAVAAQPLSLAWQLPVVGTLALALNAVVAGAVHDRARLGSLFLAAGSALLQLSVLVILFRMAR